MGVKLIRHGGASSSLLPSKEMAREVATTSEGEIRPLLTRHLFQAEEDLLDFRASGDRRQLLRLDCCFSMAFTMDYQLPPLLAWIDFRGATQVMTRGFQPMGNPKTQTHSNPPSQGTQPAPTQQLCKPILTLPQSTCISTRPKIPIATRPICRPKPWSVPRIRLQTDINRPIHSFCRNSRKEKLLSCLSK